MHFTINLGGALRTAAITAVFGLAILGSPGAAAAQDLPGGTWGLAQAVSISTLTPPGTTFDGGNIQAVSCASPGNCGAIGTYFSYTASSAAATPYPFVLSSTDGIWGSPAAVPGAVTSPTKQSPPAPAVSCAAPGDCAATWTYDDANGDGHSYLINESQGVWGQALPTTIGTVGTWLTGVSCPAAGDCAAVGDYLDGSAGSGLPFVVDSAAGAWGVPREVPGVAGLSTPPPVNASLTSISCTSPGDCVAGGYYHVSSTHGQPFLATETGGSWGQGQPVPGMTALNPSDMATLHSVSCGGPGGCTATGIYQNTGAGYDTWVAAESGGSWGPAQQLSAPAPSSRTVPESLACSQGYCALAGQYVPSATGHSKAFVASYVGGAWTAQDMPGVTGTTSSATNVSCGAPGYCTAGGFYYPAGSGISKAFLADDVDGTWAAAQDVAGLPTAAAGSEINDLSCTTPGYCTAAVALGNLVFTVSEATAATIALRTSAATMTYGDEEAGTLTATVASAAGGTPTGTVTITDGTVAVCQIALANGTGSCAVPATALPVGTDQLTATYSGDANYAAVSSTVTVTVVPATP